MKGWADERRIIAAMVYLRVVHSSTLNMGVAEPFVVRLESELERSVTLAQFNTFMAVTPLIQVFHTDGTNYKMLSVEFYTIHSIAYANNACTVHIVFQNIPNSTRFKFQTRFAWDALKLVTITMPYTLEAASSKPVVMDKKRKRAEDLEQPKHACACVKHNQALQAQISELHDQVTLMREEIMGYRSLFKDTLLKYVQPTERQALVLPEVPTLAPMVEPMVDSANFSDLLGLSGGPLGLPGPEALDFDFLDAVI
jgi:hypothetical protein